MNARIGMTAVDSPSRLVTKQTSAPGSLADLEAAWSTRKTYWASKLGRLRLGVEPVEQQLARYRRVTWMLTAIPGFLSAMLFTLFAVFGRPGIGAVVAALFFLPIVSGAWIGYFLLDRKGRRYLVELRNYQTERERFQTSTAH